MRQDSNKALLQSANQLIGDLRREYKENISNPRYVLLNEDKLHTFINKLLSVLDYAYRDVCETHVKPYAQPDVQSRIAGKLFFPNFDVPAKFASNTVLSALNNVRPDIYRLFESIMVYNNPVIHEFRDFAVKVKHEGHMQTKEVLPALTLGSGSINGPCISLYGKSGVDISNVETPSIYLENCKNINLGYNKFDFLLLYKSDDIEIYENVINGFPQSTVIKIFGGELKYEATRTDFKLRPDGNFEEMVSSIPVEIIDQSWIHVNQFNTANSGKEILPLLEAALIRIEWLIDELYKIF